jgi:hypothetical protein
MEGLFELCFCYGHRRSLKSNCLVVVGLAGNLWNVLNLLNWQI